MFCHCRLMLHHSSMKPFLWIPASCALALALSNCANSRSSGTQQAGTGPFDKNGRYIDEWADNPAKWRKPGSSSSSHESESDDVPKVALNEQPPQNANPLPPVAATNTTKVTSEPKTTVKTSEPTVAKVTPKPKPKPKPAPVKAKPKTVRYTVKKGDTLSAIASRNGTSVSALKSANSISGSLIRPGQSLVIPKK